MAELNGGTDDSYAVNYYFCFKWINVLSYKKVGNKSDSEGCVKFHISSAYLFIYFFSENNFINL